MNKIKIVTDSTTDMSSDMLNKYNVEVVPLSIHIDGETYIDRVDISPSEFMKKMKVAKELPKSSQPPVGEFVEVYDRLADEGYDVLSIHMTGGMSGTVSSARTAAQMTKANVTVIDSKYISGALAFQVVEAVKMIEIGKTMDEIVEHLNFVRDNTKLYLVVDTLENLVKGGRIGKATALIGSVLNIKPIAKLTDGELTSVTKVRSHTQAVKYLSKQFAEDVKEKSIKGVKIAHAEGLELANKLSAVITELTGFNGVEIVETTSVISTHTGPGAIGFVYYYE